jgi:endo-1,4-beta-xylanase
MGPGWGSRLAALAALIAVVASARPCGAVPTAGNSLALKTGGVNASGSYRLNNNGYVGTYINLAAPGDVTITVNASGVASGPVLPHMNVVVGDFVAGFDVEASARAYQHTFSLPAGMHFVRTEFNNDPLKTTRSLLVQNLDVAGATLANSNTSANALAAADNYIDKFRRGPAHLSLMGVDAGTPVEINQIRHDFRFGTAVGGTTVGSINGYLNNANYSNYLLQHFNTITQGNAGKWEYNEGTRDTVTMAGIDRFFEYAEQHNLDVRLHNMLWADSQQPGWVNTLLTSANGGNATAENDLRAEISERIDYFVGDGDGDMTDGDRARRYVEMDLLNEHVHQPKYWNTYEAAGIAGMFTEAAQAVTAAGSNARLYLNEYNVLQYPTDNYGVWYREDVEEITNAGGAISGIGVQYYPIATSDTDSGGHSPARIQQVFQNLSVTGLPITLSEFGVQTANNPTPEQSSKYLTETMRMVFGTPSATTFVIWGFWANDIWNMAPHAALKDANWNTTPVGLEFEELMSQWTTDLSLQAGADGSVDFTGFYGDYEVTVAGKTYLVSLDKGVNQYGLIIDLAGDFDNDGTVDAADRTMWDQAFEMGTAAGDADEDGDTDGADLLVWQQQLGLTRSTPLPESVVAAPEPSTAFLALAAAATLRRRRRAA